MGLKQVETKVEAPFVLAIANGTFLRTTHHALSPHFSEQASKVVTQASSVAFDRNQLWVILAEKLFTKRILDISEDYRKRPENEQQLGEARTRVQIMNNQCHSWMAICLVLFPALNSKFCHCRCHHCSCY